MSPVAPPALTQHKVVVGGGAHGVEHVGLVRDLELLPTEKHLAEAEVSVADVLHVVLLQRPLNDLRGVVLAGQQYALVDVPVTDALHADPDDARVGNLFVVEGLRGLWRAAG